MTKQQSKRRWATAIKHVPSSLIGEYEGISCMFTQSDDRQLFALKGGSRLYTAETRGSECQDVPRYIVLQSTRDVECIYGADSKEELISVLEQCIDGASAGEDYGWTIDQVYDLDTDKEITYHVTVTLEGL